MKLTMDIWAFCYNYINIRTVIRVNGLNLAFVLKVSPTAVTRNVRILCNVIKEH